MHIKQNTSVFYVDQMLYYMAILVLVRAAVLNKTKHLQTSPVAVRVPLVPTRQPGGLDLFGSGIPPLTNSIWHCHPGKIFASESH